jgi:hypothetical protein
MEESLVQYILDKYPHVHKSNTEVCIYLWEEVARRKGFNNMQYDPIWVEMKSIIRNHKPESIVRKRRDLVESTSKQKDQQQEYFNTYGN